MSPKRQSDRVSAFDAKTHLSQLLQEAEQGKAITITRRGKPVARLVPVGAEQEPLGREDILKGFQEIRSRAKGLVDIRDFIDEGRKR
jgi:prevent-host-death family protein